LQRERLRSDEHARRSRSVQDAAGEKTGAFVMAHQAGDVERDHADLQRESEQQGPPRADPIG
jgi:hypothetical protein